MLDVRLWLKGNQIYVLSELTVFGEWRATLACGAVRLLLVTRHSVTHLSRRLPTALCCVCLSVLFLLSDASYDQWDGRVAAAERLK